MNRITVFLLLCSILLFNCTAKNNPLKTENLRSNSLRELLVIDTTYVFQYSGNSYKAYFKIPPKCNEQLILFLPGWNYSVLDWKEKTDVWRIADSLGYATLLVEMGKSVYVDSVYPEARADYKFFPTRTWLEDSVLSSFKSYGWFDEGNDSRISHIIGLSTGGRGAIALAYELPNLGLVSAFSGDYFTMMDTSDALLRNSIGPYYKVPERWELGSNNLGNRGPLYCNVFIAHGELDKVVSVRHSKMLEERVNKNHTPRQQIFTYYPQNAGHDYSFWNEAGIKAIQFIQKSTFD